MGLGLKDLYDNELMIREDPRYRTIVQRAIQEVTKGIQRHSKIFKKSETYFTGSHYDKLRVDSRQEADVNVVLNTHGRSWSKISW